MDGKSVTEIAQLLERGKSTISRELRRNAATAGQPMPYFAQTLYQQRKEACYPHKRLENAPLRSYIQTCILEYHWSPEEIVGRIQLEHGCRLVSVPTIYRAIHAGLLNPAGASAKFALRKLRHHRKRRHKKGSEERRGKFTISHRLLREFFPKGKDITDTPEDYIQRKYHELNLRPRKCLGYKTPYEVYFSKALHLA
uniref:helix-turn-helix domain-containing protein n=1 Tax=Mitsuokella jalaludinii TaxID=187979 RepID=UPI00298C46A7|nr:helix-turn-helix domain-containing protein [Mitsuokella jalaludinii]